MEDWSSYVYAPLRCVHNYNAVDIVIFNEQLRYKEQHLVTTVLGLQSMFPDTIIRCILKYCVGPWFPRVAVLDAIIRYTVLSYSEAWHGPGTNYHLRGLFLACLSGRFVFDMDEVVLVGDAVQLDPVCSELRRHSQD